MKAVRTAVIGCGAISDIYYENMIKNFDSIEVVACCAKHLENAHRKAQQVGIEAHTYEEILSDPSIEMIVNLTPPGVHYDILRRGLEAGKHCYTEKIMTLSLEEAKELCQLADRKGLYLGSAPDTFLGAANQTALKAIADGLIGEVTSFAITANRNSTILASVFTGIHKPGGGVGMNYSVYYLTSLLSILGSAKRVSGMMTNPIIDRKNIVPTSPHFGQDIHFETETQMYGFIELESGISGTLHLDGESIVHDQGYTLLYGTKGILRLPCPNFFGGKVEWFKPGKDWRADCDAEVLPLIFPYAENTRGVGPAEMAQAIREGRSNRASKELAYHVQEVIDAFYRSNDNGCRIDISSKFDVPQPMPMQGL